MIYTVTLNPALDKTVEIPMFAIDKVNRVTALRTDPGGKGINVSKVIAALGGESVAMGILGGNTGRMIGEKLADMGLSCDFVTVPGETRTNLKIVDPENGCFTDVNETGCEVPQAVLDGLLEKLTAKLLPGDIVILSGSLPKGAPVDTYYKYVIGCKKAGAKVFLDADGAAMQEGMKAKPYLVKPNDEELSRFLGRKMSAVEELTEGAMALLAQGVEKVVVSMGSRGALYVTKDHLVRTEGVKVPVASTVGAGDSVVAAMALAEQQGLSLEEAAVFSTATGAANVMCSGTQAAERSAVEQLIPKVVCRNE